MRQQPYFCANCKQYHASCKLNMNKSSSVQYLRFSDLFSYTPHAHPQNYNLNSKAHPEQSRLVYDSSQSRKIRFSRHHQIAKISSAQNFADNQQRLNKTQTKQTRNHSNLELKEKPKFQMSTAKKKISNHSSLSKLKTLDKTIKNVQQFKQQTKNSRKQVTVHMDLPDNKKQNSKGHKGPYYVVTKLNPNDRQRGIQKSNRNSDIKVSYVYGQKDRQILTPTNKVQEFKFGDLTQSKQQIMADMEQSNVNSTVSKSQNKFQYGKFSSKKQKHEPVLTYRKQQDSQLSSRQLDYVNRMMELKQVLKSNEKNYKQSTERTIRQPEQYSKLFSKQQKQKHTQLIQKQLKNTQNKNEDNILIPKIKQKNRLKILNKLHAHRPNQNGNKSCCNNQVEKCKYFDNRCLGFSLCQEGQIHFIAGINDLL